MNRMCICKAVATLLVIVALSKPAGLRADVTLLGAARFAGDATDLSGQSEALEGGVPANRLGGISAIEYAGADDLYWLLPDRGPADGATSYRCRFHQVRLKVQPDSTKPVSATLVSTAFLRNEQGQNLVGSAAEFNAAAPAQGLRFDPEAIRFGLGRFYISDEYGPFIAEFSETGFRTRLLKVPSRFQVLHPSENPEEEGRLNTSGRQSNAGMEGMAITTDGKHLVGIMQRPLIQDSEAGTAGGKRRGRNNRILQLELPEGPSREYAYVLEDSAHGVSEILAINDHEFLVLERDGKGGDAAECKRLYQIDLAGASDVSSRDAFPAEELPKDVRPVKKSLFLDLLDPRFGIRGAACPEKFEGLAFGPDLADGRRLLVVACDNDFEADKPMIVFAFAVDRGDLPQFAWSLRGAKPPSVKK